MSEYEAVAETVVYRNVNAHLVELLDPPAGAYVLDVACGTGSLTELLLARDPAVRAWASDPDESMLAACRQLLGDRVGLLLARAEEVGRMLPPESLDAVVIGNAIHLVEDIEATLRSLVRVVKPGGRLALNTAFYDGAERPEDRPLYWALVLKARSAARALGSPPAARRTPRALAKRPLAPERYPAATTAAGMRVVASEEVPVTLDAELIRKIVGAPVFARGALPGVPIQIATAALEQAVHEIAAERAGTPIQRNWYYLVVEREE